MVIQGGLQQSGFSSVGRKVMAARGIFGSWPGFLIGVQGKVNGDGKEWNRGWIFKDGIHGFTVKGEGFERGDAGAIWGSNMAW